jgi:hypothetical protein
VFLITDGQILGASKQNDSIVPLTFNTTLVISFVSFSKRGEA